MSIPERPAYGAVPFRDRLLLGLRRLNRRRLLAILLTVLAVVIVNGVVARARATVAQLGTPAPVVVATREIPAGTVLTEADLANERWPLNAFPETELAASPVGRVVRATLMPGEAIPEARLFPTTGLVGPGDRQITVPQPIAPPPVATGDRVELIGVLPSEGPFPAKPRLLATGTVVAKDEFGISVAVPNDRILTLVEYLVRGVIEIVVLP